ncbi:MAG: FAD-dependent oxidoreductase [Hydrogenophaga sp.]|nr:FAD-dependent oxidoreductase [Hydrogenophaga sp.]
MHFNTDLRNILVVGGGIAGMAAAIRLLEEGADVTLIDRDASWSVYGNGITCSGVTYRALYQLGIGRELVEVGAPHSALKIFDYISGAQINEITLPRMMGENMPAGGGILRPDLHNILSSMVRTKGCHVRLGLTIEDLSQDDDGVDVVFTDGSNGRYDLVIGADGLFSKVRQLVFPEVPKPRYTGQASWRALFDLPKEWEDTAIFCMAQHIKVGFIPCAPGKMYMFVLEPLPDNPRREPATWPTLLRNLLADAGGDVADLRDEIGPDTVITYRPLETVFVDGDWFKQRVVLIGDSAHATTPHLASGAGIAVEDALVLVEELKRADGLDAGLRAFMNRRLERARTIVSHSLRLGELELERAPMHEHGKLMQAATIAISAPF